MQQLVFYGSYVYPVPVSVLVSVFALPVWMQRHVDMRGRAHACVDWLEPL